jgi:hypothetical protein
LQESESFIYRTQRRLSLSIKIRKKKQSSLLCKVIKKVEYSLRRQCHRASAVLARKEKQRLPQAVLGEDDVPGVDAAHTYHINGVAEEGKDLVDLAVDRLHLHPAAIGAYFAYAGHEFYLWMSLIESDINSPPYFQPWQKMSPCISNSYERPQTA